MAFTGVAVVKQITDKLVLITGLSLAGDASGIIGLFGDAGAGVELPDAFNPKPYVFGDVEVELSESIRVSMELATDVTAAVPISVVKTDAPFRATLHNDSAATVSAGLSIYVEWQ